VREDAGSAASPDDSGEAAPALPHLRRTKPRRGRLSRSAEFDRVYRQGRSVANRWLVLYAFPRAEAGRLDASVPRLGLSVSRKVGGAVDRNRVKRLVREAFDVAAGRLPADQDFVVVARPAARELAQQQGLEGMREALDELLAKALSAPAAR
jgi:ribonuclease P protein component